MSVQPIPEGFNTVSCYLVVSNSVEAMAFYEKAFGAEPGMRMAGPGDSTMHAEVTIGNSVVMMSDENPAWDTKSPLTLGGNGSSLHIYTEDVDAAFKRAVDAGCSVVFPVADMFWGDRYGKVKDPYGHEWGLATHTEDLSPEEIGKRQAEFMAQLAAEGGECGGEKAEG